MRQRRHPAGRAIPGAGYRAKHAARRVLLHVGLAGVIVAAGAIAGCAGDEPPPATIREFTEPTETVDQLVTGEETASAAVGSLTQEEVAELEQRVQLISVGYAADGAYLIVNFYAPPRLAIYWQPGQMYVIDQATGTKYATIPFMPKIGYLIARPGEEGQPGYVMLENQPPLEPGSSVTVVLGGFSQDVTVEDSNLAVP